MRNTNINVGQVRGTRYQFAIGEGLPLHDHDVNSAHLTFVMKGRIQISGPSILTQVLEAGAVYDFAPNSPHAILALDADTIIWNAIKGPI